MNCFLLTTLLLLTVIGNTYGRIVSFKLITFGKKAKVVVDGTPHDLFPIDDFSGVQSAAIICPDEEFKYYYTLNDQSEGITRTLPENQLETHIEFFKRAETIRKLKGLGYPPDKPQWTRSIGKKVVFDDSYIPTIILDNGSREYFTNPYSHDTYTLGRFTMILKDEVFTETDVESKAQNRFQDKFQWRVKLQNKIHKRKVFKFRAGSMDPTFLREALYGDVARAIGNPVHNQVIVRVYLEDGTPIGLYLMIEVTSSKSFIKSQFYADPATGKIVLPEKLGYILDCSTGADFRENASISAFQYKPEEGETNDRIRHLIRAMHEVNVEDESDVAEFSKKWLDLDTFFKALALEYLTGDWDSYWMYTSNFVMYDDPNESSGSNIKYYFIDQDFDQTFGIGISDKINTYGHEFPNQSYKTLVDRTWNVASYDGPNREAIDLFLRKGVTKKMFEQHLIDIVKHVFNPVALGRRISEYKDRYIKEIEWDYQIDRLYRASGVNRTRYEFTIDDFYNNLYSTGVKSAPWGLKDWIQKRAKTVAHEFDFEWDQTPLDPIEEEEQKVIQPNITIPEPDDDQKLHKDGASMIKSTSTFTLLTISAITILILELII